MMTYMEKVAEKKREAEHDEGMITSDTMAKEWKVLKIRINFN